jgi:IS4 transposase
MKRDNFLISDEEDLTDSSQKEKVVVEVVDGGKTNSYERESLNFDELKVSSVFTPLKKDRAEREDEKYDNVSYSGSTDDEEREKMAELRKQYRGNF